MRIIVLISFLAAFFIIKNVSAQISEKDVFKSVSSGRVDILKKFLETSPNIDKPYGRKKLTLLNHAVRSGNFNAVILLAEQGANLNKESRGNTPLINAILKRQLFILHYLIRQGADLNLTAKRGNTPLITAAKNGRLEFVKMLIENGADTRIKNNSGLMALDFANMANYPEVAKYLVRIIEMRNYYQKNPNYTDGPHIKRINDTLVRMFYMEYDTAVNFPVMVDNYYAFDGDTVELSGFAGDRQTYKVIRNILPDPDHYQNISKIMAIGDIHGYFSALAKYLKAVEVIDENHNWIWGDGHLVMLGDIFDRGSMVTETLWLLYRLDCQARQYGGRVHLLLGNHEIMVMLNDVRYLNAKYKLFSHYFHYDYNELYDSQTLLGQWLRSRNTVIKINDIMFSHAGISPVVYNKGLSINTINNLIRNFLANDPNAPNKDATVTSLLLNADGPLWFRGYFHKLYGYPTFITSDLIDSLFTFYGVKAMAIGHTEVDEITPMYDNRLIAVDMPLREGSYIKEALLFENGYFLRLKPDGKKEALFELVE
jgi:hypothetical protein